MSISLRSATPPPHFSLACVTIHIHTNSAQEISSHPSPSTLPYHYFEGPISLTFCCRSSPFQSLFTHKADATNQTSHWWPLSLKTREVVFTEKQIPCGNTGLFQEAFSASQSLPHFRSPQPLSLHGRQVLTHSHF